MLTGAELLTKIKELGPNVAKSDVVRECGYVSTKKDGSERLNFTAFYSALLEAKGVEIGSKSAAPSNRSGRKLSYRTKVQFNGNLMVGKAYTSLLGMEPGDEYEIKLGRKNITLIPVGDDSEGPVDPEDDAAGIVPGDDEEGFEDEESEETPFGDEDEEEEEEEYDEDEE